MKARIQTLEEKILELVNRDIIKMTADNKAIPDGVHTHEGMDGDKKEA
jgi:hypothetical protein